MSHFNQVANEWDSPQKVEMMKTLAKRVIELAGPKQDLKILDFGGGTGLFGLEFEKYAKDLEVIDTSQGMLDVFSEKTKDDARFSSHLINLEEESLNQSYDLIISSMAFHHLNKPFEVLKKLKAGLNENGKILIVDLDQEDGTFHPDNEAMGVKHFGFARTDLEGWGQELGLSTQWHLINEIDKNDRTYGQFLMIYS